jgi:hypothetical protein
MNKALLLCALAMPLAGCVDSQLVAYDTDLNFLAFNHPFTDKAIAEVRTRADRLCAQRKQVAIEASKTCSLNQCTTNYQCVDAADAVKYGL